MQLKYLDPNYAGKASYISFNRIVPLASGFYTTYPEYDPIACGTKRKSNEEELMIDLKAKKSTTQGRFVQAYTMMVEDTLGIYGPCLDRRCNILRLGELEGEAIPEN